MSFDSLEDKIARFAHSELVGASGVLIMVISPPSWSYESQSMGCSNKYRKFFRCGECASGNSASVTGPKLCCVRQVGVRCDSKRSAASCPSSQPGVEAMRQCEHQVRIEGSWTIHGASY